MKIEIWSDVVCPWCYIGKRRLESALDAFDEEVEVLWRSFQLDPSEPAEAPDDLDEALAAKYGMTVEQAREMMAHMTRTGAEEGLELNFERARRGNTLDAHRLLHFAATRGVQPAMKERLLLAYMTEGRPISHRDELARLAADVGLDGDEVRGMLETDAFLEDVRSDQIRARKMGVSGVPFFLMDGRLAVAGAHPSDVLLQALRRASSEAAAASRP